MAVELDGSQHFEPEAIEYDKIRTEFLETLSIKVMRFSNIDVDKNFKEVCHRITEGVKFP